MNMNGAVMTLARYEARQIIKRELYGQGIKLSHVEASEITRKANQYVEDHPEIIAFATERYLDLVKRGVLRPHICVMETSSFVIDFALGFWPRFLSPPPLRALPDRQLKYGAYQFISAVQTSAEECRGQQSLQPPAARMEAPQSPESPPELVPV